MFCLSFFWRRGFSGRYVKGVRALWTVARLAARRRIASLTGTVSSEMTGLSTGIADQLSSRASTVVVAGTTVMTAIVVVIPVAVLRWSAIETRRRSMAIIVIIIVLRALSWLATFC